MEALYLGSDLARAGGTGGARRSSTAAGDARRNPSYSGRAERATVGSAAPGAAVGAPGASARVTESRASREAGGARGASADHRLSLFKVPCSKADVFGTKLLTPLEKRRLMRFLLFASDWGLQRAGEDVMGRNEAGLGRGRSLRRPQNREAASADFDAAAHAGKPFQAFLESCGLPERVRAMVTHALALLPGTGGAGSPGEVGGEAETTTEAGLEAVYRCGVVPLAGRASVLR